MQLPCQEEILHWTPPGVKAILLAILTLKLWKKDSLMKMKMTPLTQHLYISSFKVEYYLVHQEFVLL